MSDNWLILIPNEPDFVPKEESIALAETQLSAALPLAEEIEAILTEETRFIDCGGNFDSISCPFTKKPIDMDVWSEAMHKAAETDFTDLSFVSPFTGQKTSLNDLVYDFPQGFAKFSIEAMNPDGDLSEQQIQEFEKMLGCKLRKIWRHI